MHKFFFIITLLFTTSNIFAATGSGHAQAELGTPLSVQNTARKTNFGTIAIDPAAGSQTVSLTASSSTVRTCPASYVCTGAPTAGQLLVRGSPNAAIYLDLSGSTAVLDDGTGNTLVYDPGFWDDVDTLANTLDGSGTRYINVGGSITFTGNETSGYYSSENAGGSGYQITVNY